MVLCCKVHNGNKVDHPGELMSPSAVKRLSYAIFSSDTSLWQTSKLGLQDHNLHPALPVRNRLVVAWPIDSLCHLCDGLCEVVCAGEVCLNRCPRVGLEQSGVRLVWALELHDLLWRCHRDLGSDRGGNVNIR